MPTNSSCTIPAFAQDVVQVDLTANVYQTIQSFFQNVQLYQHILQVCYYLASNSTTYENQTTLLPEMYCLRNIGNIQFELSSLQSKTGPYPQPEYCHIRPEYHMVLS